MRRYLWSVPLMFIIGVVIGKFATDQSWPIAILDGVILTAIFNGIIWLAGNRTKKSSR